MPSDDGRIVLKGLKFVWEIRMSRPNTVIESTLKLVSVLNITRTVNKKKTVNNIKMIKVQCIKLIVYM